MKGSFDHSQLGGTDSIYRRLGYELVGSRHDVAFVHYRCSDDSIEHVANGVRIFRYMDLESALARLLERKGHILVNAICREDRLRFARFRRENGHKLKFYFVATLFQESLVSRTLHFLEMTLWPYNGGALCLSPRLVRACRVRRNEARLMLPPVPRCYYVAPSEKPTKRCLTLTFMGRPVPGKGGDDAIEIFRHLRGKAGIEIQVYTYVWPDNQENRSGRDWLVSQRDVRYAEASHSGWSPAVELEVGRILKHTDILLLPYRRLSSSIDTPLLLLEGMAANCCVLTRPLGDIRAFYGESDFLIHGDGFVERAVALIERSKRCPDLLARERLRIARQVRKWDFSVSAVAERLARFLSSTT